MSPAEPGAESSPEPPATYAAAGVDIKAGDGAVERIRAAVASTARPEVLGGIGGFAGAFAFDPSRYREPVLVASTDGVGTKALIAQATGRYDTIGIDLVAMCVDDLVCVGAEPLFLLDYVATGKVDPDQMHDLVSGVAAGCRQAGCALLGGEMAEHPGVLDPGEFDLAGFAVGAVDRSSMLGADQVTPGDLLVGLPSPGLRSNGYTLARHVLQERAGLSLDAPAWPGADQSLAEVLLLPSLVYAPAVLRAVRSAEVHAVAHITGGGIPGNLSRAVPPGCDAWVDPETWETPRIFTEIQHLGNVETDEMRRVFNLGLGMVLVVAPSSVPAALDTLVAAGHAARVVGRVSEGSGAVHVGKSR